MAWRARAEADLRDLPSPCPTTPQYSVVYMYTSRLMGERVNSIMLTSERLARRNDTVVVVVVAVGVEGKT